MKKLLILATIAVASLLWTSNALADDDGEKGDAAVAKVPEPASLTLLAIGLAGLPLLRRRRS